MTKTRIMFNGKVLLNHGPTAMPHRWRDGSAFKFKNGPYLRTPWITFSWNATVRVLYVRWRNSWLTVKPGPTSTAVRYVA